MHTGLIMSVLIGLGLLRKRLQPNLF